MASRRLLRYQRQMTPKRAVGALVVLALAALSVYSYHGDLSAEELAPKYTSEASRFVDLDGMRVHYRVEGAGPTLLLLHGTNSSLHTWEGWVERLRSDFRVVSLDLPGYGLTGPDPEARYSPPEVARFLRRFTDAIGVEEFAIAGNSRGGAVAWNYACLYPDRVRALVLIDSAGLPRDEPLPFILRMQGLPGIRQMASRLTPRFVVERGTRQAYGDPSAVSDAVIDRYFDLLLREGNRGAVATMMEDEHDWGDASCLGGLDVPTLVQWGELDRWILPSYGRRFEESIAGARLEVYPGVGHVPMEEAPGPTAADARSFLLEMEGAER